MNAAADVALLLSPALSELLPEYNMTRVSEAAEVRLLLPPLRFMAFVLTAQCP